MPRNVVPTDQQLSKAMEAVRRGPHLENLDKWNFYFLLADELARRDPATVIEPLACDESCGSDDKDPCPGFVKRDWVGDVDPLAVMRCLQGQEGPDGLWMLERWVEENDDAMRTVYALALAEARRQGVRVPRGLQSIPKWEVLPMEPAEPLTVDDEDDALGLMVKGPTAPMRPARPNEIVLQTNSGTVYVLCGHEPGCDCEAIVAAHGRRAVRCHECGSPGRFAFIHPTDGIVANCRECHRDFQE